jgi:hypothetical protein
MSTDPQQADKYREEIKRWANALALARTQAVGDVLAAGFSDFHVRMFTDGNLEKRLTKLENQLEFVGQAIELVALIKQFITTVPLAAYDTGTSDGERFLRWLEETQDPSAEERDYIACQRARHAVESEARLDRLAHIRFQELASLAEEHAAALEEDPNLRVHLNPVRAWSRFHTKALLDEEADTPANVLFFPVGNQISTAVLEPEGQALVRELALYAPCTLDDWAAMSELAGREELVELCRDLAGMGLVAFT